MGEELLNVHKLRKSEVYQLCLSLQKSQRVIAKHFLNEHKQWKYLFEFQDEMIRAQLHFAKAMEFLDPWDEKWKYITQLAQKTLHDLEMVDRRIQNLGGTNGTGTESTN